jgi:hypothetical protein
MWDGVGPPRRAEGASAFNFQRDDAKTQRRGKSVKDLGKLPAPKAPSPAAE